MTVLYERLAPQLRRRRRRKLLAPPPAGFVTARRPDSTAASRISDGGVAEGSTLLSQTGTSTTMLDMSQETRTQNLRFTFHFWQ